MQTSIFIAKLLGPVLVIATLGMLFNAKLIRAIAREVVGSLALLYVFGFIDLIGGIAVVLVHNRWVWDWPVIITILGWVAIVRGAVRMLWPDQVKKFATKALRNENTMMIAGIVMLILGAVLCYFGYRA
jgi:uncharacterized protein YjeT (DUF2065 family)